MNEHEAIAQTMQCSTKEVEIAETRSRQWMLSALKRNREQLDSLAETVLEDLAEHDRHTELLARYRPSQQGD